MSQDNLTDMSTSGGAKGGFTNVPYPEDGTVPPRIYPKKRWPVLNQDLAVEEAFRLMRWSDAAIWAGGTLGCWTFGFLRGSPVRFATAGFMGAVGFTWGSFVVLQNVRNRIIGLKENDREAKYYAGLEED